MTEFIIHRAALLPALSHARTIVEARNTIPIMHNLLIAPMDGQINITTSDLDMQITATVEAVESKAGEGTTMSAARLYQFVSQLGESAQLKFADSDNGRMVVSAGRSRVTLPTLPARDFPLTQASAPEQEMTLKATKWAHIMEAVGIAVSTEETRYYLNGIFMHIDGDEIAFVATDGHRFRRIRLGVSQIAGDPIGDQDSGIIIGRKAVATMQKIIGKAEGDAAISWSQNRLNMRFHDIEMTTKLVDGQFPDYKRVIPAKNTDKMGTVSTTEFIR